MVLGLSGNSKTDLDPRDIAVSNGLGDDPFLQPQLCAVIVEDGSRVLDHRVPSETDPRRDAPVLQIQFSTDQALDVRDPQRIAEILSVTREM